MNNVMVIQGRNISNSDITLIRSLISQNPLWNRTKLSREICTLWNWQDLSGRLKDMACRSLLIKLEKLSLISLPPSQNPNVNFNRSRSLPCVPHDTSPIISKLKDLGTIFISTVNDKHNNLLFNCLISKYHYLGFSTTVGENIKYLVTDKFNRPLACLLFGSAAWKTSPRDSFLGWNLQTRTKNLHLITNNTRFLILPWVKVYNLASFVLSKIANRISSDWLAKYNHPLFLLETFVDCSRFTGACYKAANWLLLGQTKGRSRNDTFNSLRVPIKDIYIYPLIKNFKELLNK